MSKDSNRYHHGNLRQALLRAGIDILDKKGMKGLTLRACAAQAGVSHAAPQHHFGNMRNLLTALAIIAHERLRESLLEEYNGEHGSPPDKLRAMGRGYIIFAARNPGLFRLMFSIEELDCDNQDLKDAGSASFGALLDAIAPAAEFLREDYCSDNMNTALMLWSSLHGYSHLMLEGQFREYAQDLDGFLELAPDVVGVLLKR